MQQIDPALFFTSLFVILLAISIHEFAHAKIADAAGDPTPRLYGRVTLNPLNHLDFAGTLMIIFTSLTGFGIGWGRPVPVNPNKMRNPRWDHFASVAAGPISNLIQALIYAIVLRVAISSGLTGPDVLYRFSELRGLPLFLVLGVLINIGLCVFNLIPLGPLDGHWLVGAFLPDPLRYRWYLWNRNVGGFVFLAIIIMGQMWPELNFVGRTIIHVSLTAFRFLVGV
jgi:Zn-dependent protease